MSGRAAAGIATVLPALLALYFFCLAVHDVPKNHRFRDPKGTVAALSVVAGVAVVSVVWVWVRPRRGWVYFSLAASALLFLYSMVLMLS
jgi:hypothetical protein